MSRCGRAIFVACLELNLWMSFMVLVVDTFESRTFAIKVFIKTSNTPHHWVLIEVFHGPALSHHHVASGSTFSLIS